MIRQYLTYKVDKTRGTGYEHGSPPGVGELPTPGGLHWALIVHSLVDLFHDFRFQIVLLGFGLAP